MPWYNGNAMRETFKTKVDKFGRIVIPKEMRADLGISPGTVIVIEGSAEEITIRPLPEQPVIYNKKGILVARSKMTGDIESHIKKLRSERIISLSE